MDAIFFDIGGVILDSESVRAAHERFIADLHDEHGLENPDAALETWRTELGTHFREREGTEFRSARVGYERAIAAIGVDGEWEPVFERALSREIEANPGAVETIEALSERDVHLGVLSDVDTDEGRRILDTFGIIERFDSLTTSEEVGKTKPDSAMFERALEKSGTAPEKSLMIGDRYRHDMEGAKQMGMRTAAYGADEGPAVDYRLDHLHEVLDLG